MKHYKLIGIFTCVLLIVSCFLPWAYYADLHKSFTGFFSEQNIYGKPGKAIVFIAVCSAVLILLDKVWAKRTFLFLVAIHIAYLIKTYALFTTCYSTICPQKQYGLYLLILGSVLLLIVALFPNTKIDTNIPEVDEA
ncbi:MAG TPA: hypothetical protein VN726_12270 [Hanamia sp.]|jgi:hypothetical protein|nr:hypothetical protein [Hanamia sp.]